MLLRKDIYSYSFEWLTDKFIVDMFSHLEEERLYYRGYGFFNRAQGETDDDYHLDSRWIGTRLWASEQVLDALALCTEFGRSSILISITPIANWPEFKKRLSRG